MAALDAAQANGGDLRGMMSAAMLIVKNGVRENEGKVLDLESNVNLFPLVDLRKQLEPAQKSVSRSERKFAPPLRLK